jgi:hypothetical protein
MRPEVATLVEAISTSTDPGRGYEALVDVLTSLEIMASQLHDVRGSLNEPGHRGIFLACADPVCARVVEMVGVLGMLRVGARESVGEVPYTDSGSPRRPSSST